VSKRDLLAVALKVVGVVTFVSSLAAIPWTIESINVTLTGNFVGVTNKPFFVVMSIGAVLVGVLIGAYLAMKGDAVARYLERDERVIDMAPAKWVRPGFGIAVRVVGVMLIDYALPNIVETFARRYLQHGEAGTTGVGELALAFLATNWAELTREVARVVIGAYLLFGAAGLARLVFDERRDETGATQE